MEDPKSLAHIWMCSVSLAVLEALKKQRNEEYGKIEESKDSRWISLCLSLSLSIGTPFYQEGCNICIVTLIHMCSLDDLWENKPVSDLSES